MKKRLLFEWQLFLLLRSITRALGHQPDSAVENVPIYNEAADNGTYGYYPIRTYATDEVITSPQTNWLQWDSRCDDGLLYFITPKGWSLPNPGPMILDHRGKLVWSQHFDNEYGGQAYNLQVQKYQGVEYLTFWLGDDRIRGHGSGFYYMLNSSYDIVHSVGAANGLEADLHEFIITPEGTALMTMYQPVPYDLTSFPEYDPMEEDLDPEDVGIPYIWDCIFQEVDITTRDLVFEWRALDHLNLNETYRHIGPGGTKLDPFDWFHINSLEKDQAGNYLISARYTHSITYVDGQTGDIIWTLGGRRNDFLDLSDGMGLNFAWQHDARFLSTDALPGIYSTPEEQPGLETRLITLFDNAAEDQHYDFGLEYARGLVLEVTFPTPGTARSPPGSSRDGLDMHWGDGVDVDIDDLNSMKVQHINGSDTNYTVRVIKSYENLSHFRSSSQGSLQVLPQSPGEDPKIFVGYGLNAVWTEFDANGSVLCDVHFGANISWERGDIHSYRAYKFPWTGHPETPPIIETSADDDEVYVSWNGATEVAEWILQSSHRDKDSDRYWKNVTRAPSIDFETTLAVPENFDARYLRVIAADRNGRKLPYGTSETIDMGDGISFLPVLLADETGGLSSRIIFVFMVCTVCVLLGLYELYRRYLSWRSGKRSRGALRWRKASS